MGEFGEGNGDYETSLADLLIEGGVDASAKDDLSRTAVHVAAYHGHVGLVSHLVSRYGQASDVVDAGGGTALTSMFLGGTASTDLLYALAKGATDPGGLVSGEVAGIRNAGLEEKWRGLDDVEGSLLRVATPKSLEGERGDDDTHGPVDCL